MSNKSTKPEYNLNSKINFPELKPRKAPVKKTPAKTLVKKTPAKTLVKKTPAKTPVKKTSAKTPAKKSNKLFGLSQSEMKNELEKLGVKFIPLEKKLSTKELKNAKNVVAVGQKQYMCTYKNERLTGNKFPYELIIPRNNKKSKYNDFDTFIKDYNKILKNKNNNSPNIRFGAFPTPPNKKLPNVLFGNFDIIDILNSKYLSKEEKKERLKELETSNKERYNRLRRNTAIQLKNEFNKSSNNKFINDIFNKLDILGYKYSLQ